MSTKINPVIPESSIAGQRAAQLRGFAYLRAINVTPHVTQNDCITATGKRRRSAIDGCTTRTKAMACRNRVGR